MAQMPVTVEAKRSTDLSEDEAPCIFDDPDVLACSVVDEATGQTRRVWRHEVRPNEVTEQAPGTYARQMAYITKHNPLVVAHMPGTVEAKCSPDSSEDEVEAKMRVIFNENGRKRGRGEEVSIWGD